MKDVFVFCFPGVTILECDIFFCVRVEGFRPKFHSPPPPRYFMLARTSSRLFEKAIPCRRELESKSLCIVSQASKKTFWWVHFKVKGRG
ncbi:hypothetical protein CEXT_565541 [Caerostris extrusa]|uniref:Secreted protein n=1 Tax=Caerostris extrusa TaxID=172846 RepID=A0AAV4WI90_CAEEX|nr:hypothetical protein CEXT_565541 [Caerostris extrusa]